MNKIKKILVAFLGSALLLGNIVTPAQAVAPWNVTGDYEITFMLTGDLTPYTHDAFLTQSVSAITGDGGFPAGGPYTYHWNTTSGSILVDTINLTMDYDLGAVGTIMNMTGTIAADGTLSGTWDDNFGGPRTGTWSITRGVSTPLIHTPSNGAVVSQSAFTEIDWTDVIGANPPFQYRYEAYSDVTYTALVYGSGWTLSNSEIPTPGTPPGDYYVRVQARDEGLVESDWSNGPGNVYKITVTADPVNPFPVPALCNQNISYNLIEGTGGSEVLNGTAGPDLILAKGGSDSVNGLGGDDCIDGAGGSDSLKGGVGNDVVLGGDGSDSIQGEGGNDDLYGQGGSDAVRGGAGNDDLFGGDNSDSLKGDGGTDTSDGGNGSDACNAETETTCEA